MNRWSTMILLLAVIVLAISAGPYAERADANTLYTVRPGDSLWTIGQKFHVSPWAIAADNVLQGSLIKPGQVLQISTTGAIRATAFNAARSQDQSHMDLLARVIEAESRGEPYRGMLGVGAVIVNRVNSSQFPNTIQEVIYQPHAFESVTNGLIWRFSPSPEAYQAANEALAGHDPTHGSLFFWNPSKPVSRWIWSRSIVTQIGNHVFAR